MFAAHSLFFATNNQTTNKQLKRSPLGITVTGLFCGLLIGLPTLAAAEDVATDATPTVKAAAPAENTTEKKPDGEQQKGRVARAIFTSAIVDREPVDDLSTVSGGTQRVFFFTDLRELAGQIVTHRWEYNGNVMAEVTFKVGDGARWRVYSSKNLLPDWTGQWTVVVSNESGWPIKASMFEYTAEAAEKNTDNAKAETTETVSP